MDVRVLINCPAGRKLLTARGFAWNAVPVRTAFLSFLVSFSYTIIISHGLRCPRHYFFQQSSGIKDVSLHKARCPCAHIKGYSLSLAQVQRRSVARSCFAASLSAKEEPIHIHQKISWVFRKKLWLAIFWQTKKVINWLKKKEDCADSRAEAKESH